MMPGHGGRHQNQIYTRSMFEMKHFENGCHVNNLAFGFDVIVIEISKRYRVQNYEKLECDYG